MLNSNINKPAARLNVPFVLIVKFHLKNNANFVANVTYMELN